jgi:hypothetical protein
MEQLGSNRIGPFPIQQKSIISILLLETIERDVIHSIDFARLKFLHTPFPDATKHSYDAVMQKEENQKQVCSIIYIYMHIYMLIPFEQIPFLSSAFRRFANIFTFLTIFISRLAFNEHLISSRE